MGVLDSSLKNRIIGVLRKASYAHPPRKVARDKQKVAPAAFRCESCQVVLYTGKKQEIPQEILNNFDKVKRSKMCLDHKIPIIDPVKGWQGFDSFIERLFCKAEGFQVLCPECHNSKTYLENELRKQNKKD